MLRIEKSASLYLPSSFPIDILAKSPSAEMFEKNFTYMDEDSQARTILDIILSRMSKLDSIHWLHLGESVHFWSSRGMMM